jgi:hypothetical protein
MLAVIRQGEGALAAVLRLVLQQVDPADGSGQCALTAASNLNSREWERVMLDHVVTYWVRLFSALIGGSAGLKAAEEARRAAEAKAAKVVRGGAKAKAVEAGRRVAKSKAPEGAPSCAATHPGKRPEEMAVPPADLRLIKGIVAKPTRAASQKRTAPRMRAK